MGLALLFQTLSTPVFLVSYPVKFTLRQYSKGVDTGPFLNSRQFETFAVSAWKKTINSNEFSKEERALVHDLMMQSYRGTTDTFFIYVETTDTREVTPVIQKFIKLLVQNSVFSDEIAQQKKEIEEMRVILENNLALTQNTSQELEKILKNTSPRNWSFDVFGALKNLADLRLQASYLDKREHDLGVLKILGNNNMTPKPVYPVGWYNLLLGILLGLSTGYIWALKRFKSRSRP